MARRVPDLSALERLRSAGPEKGLASIAGGWKGNDDLVAAIESRPRRGRRRAPSLESRSAHLFDTGAVSELPATQAGRRVGPLAPVGPP